MLLDAQLDVPGVGPQRAGSADGERERRGGVAEAGVGDHGYALELGLGADDLRQRLAIHVGGALEASQHDPPHALEARLVDERLERAVEVLGLYLLVVLPAPHGAFEARPAGRS